MPWNEDIDDKYEFRIFVVNKKLTAVSQQNSRKLYHYTMEELDDIEYSLNNISFIDKMPYSTYIADVFINMDTKICYLIELNVFGASSGAGSALFNWVNDYNILHSHQNNPIFRYLSIINI